MRQYCVLCHKIHENPNWKYSVYETTEGKKDGWFCDKWYKPSPDPEYTTAQIKTDRNRYAKSLLQPFRNGELSQEYVQAHGADRLMVTPEQIKKAKPVWKDILPSNWKKSK